MLAWLGKFPRKVSAAAPEAAPAPRSAPVLPPHLPALAEAIRQQSSSDAMIGPKIAGRQVLSQLSDAIADARGVHAESLLCALGALAGYACQISVVERARARGPSAEAGLQRVTTRDGRQWLFGDALNWPLAESEHSIWSFAAAGAQHAGASALPDVGEMFQHWADVLGRSDFEMPRVETAHRPREQPLHYRHVHWSALFPWVRVLCPEPAHWPMAFGVAVQEAILAAKVVVSPAIACRIVMESAILASKSVPPDA